MSFGYSRGVPLNADLVFDMRFLRNPHWEEALRPKTGLDPDVAAYVLADPAYEEAVQRIEQLLTQLLPRHSTEERRVGNECVSPCSSRRYAQHQTKNTHKQ